MPVRDFDGSDDALNLGIGNCAMSYGTIAIVFRADTTDSTDRLIIVGSASTPSGIHISYQSNNELRTNFSVNADSVTTIVDDEWYIAVVTKATGTKTPRWHIYRFSTSSWTHENSAEGAQGDHPGTMTDIGIGSQYGLGNFADAAIAAAGVWANQVLSDGDCETLSGGLVKWWNLQPSGLWAFDQTATAVDVRDYTGGGAHQALLVGTTVLSDDPPMSLFLPHLHRGLLGVG